MMELFKTFSEKSNFFEALKSHDFSENNQLPVLVENRENLKKVIEDSNGFYTNFSTPKKVIYGVDLSGLSNFEGYKSALAEKWLTIEEMKNYEFHNTSIVFFGIYEDFRYNDLKSLFLNAEKLKVKICAIIGRDICSLSWQCAKQFVEVNHDNVAVQNGILSCKKINLKRKEKWLEQSPNLVIFDKPELHKMDIQKILLSTNWDSLLLYGHGKEDNLNLEEYTVCGRNIEVSRKVTFSPQCGYCNQGCFKDEHKLIPACDIIAQNLTLGSCNNAPFSDLALYDEKYSLLLNAIDGVAKTINVAVTAQNSDYIELDRVVANSFQNIPNIINSSLKGAQSQLSMLQIGIEPQESVEFEKAYPSEALIESINRARQYQISGFLDENGKISKLIRNFLIKSADSISRNSLYNNMGNSEKQWKQKINVLNEFIGEEILKDQFNSIMSFDDYETSRSYIDENSVEVVKCECGNDALHFKFKPFSMYDFSIEMLFCYRCGDKAIKMEKTPDMRVYAPDHVERGVRIPVKVEIDSKESDDIYFGWFVPSYIEDNVLNAPKKMKKIKGGDQIEFEIEFDDKIAGQGYYFTVFTIQNLGISLRRHFISVEGETK